MSNRDYDKECEDYSGRQYAYSFDFDVMHRYMMESFKPFFVDCATGGRNVLELGSFEGAFTKRLLPHFTEIYCVDASKSAVKKAKERLGDRVTIINELFEDVALGFKYDNIILTHVLEHMDDPVQLLKRINDEWLSDVGKLFLVCPNANAPSRQIAVKMGIVGHNQAITEAEWEHGHRRTYTLDTLERDATKAGLRVVYRSGIFFKALANFQWDQLLPTEIISDEYLDGCYKLGQNYPDLCASVFLLCEKG